MCLPKSNFKPKEYSSYKATFPNIDYYTEINCEGDVGLVQTFVANVCNPPDGISGNSDYYYKVIIYCVISVASYNSLLTYLFVVLLFL